MKKFVSVICLLALVSLLLSLPVSAAGEAESTGVTINVYNWGEYIANGEDGTMDINREFEKRTGIKVNYTTFDSNETMYTKIKGGGVSYDVIIPSDYMVEKMIAEGLVQELNFDNIPNYQYIDESLRTEPYYDPSGKYSVPYTWGTTCLIYNTKQVTEPVDSWDMLWNEKYKGKILMFDNPRDAFGIAQFKNGFSLNTTDENELKQCEESLKEQKQLADTVYEMDQTIEKMANGSAYIAPYYVGDAVRMYDSNPDLKIVFPKEGVNKYVDAMCIPTGAKHKAEAEAYINFLCDPEIAYENMLYVAYASPVTQAAERHKQDIAADYGEEWVDVFYPPESVKTEGFIKLPDETNRMMDEMWASIKTWHGGGSNTLVIVLVVVLFVVLAGGVILLRVRKKRRERELDE